VSIQRRQYNDTVSEQDIPHCRLILTVIIIIIIIVIITRTIFIV